MNKSVNTTPVKNRILFSRAFDQWLKLCTLDTETLLQSAHHEGNISVYTAVLPWSNIANNRTSPQFFTLWCNN